MTKLLFITSMPQVAAPLEVTLPASKPLYIFPFQKMCARPSHWLPDWLGVTSTSSEKPKPFDGPNPPGSGSCFPAR